MYKITTNKQAHHQIDTAWDIGKFVDLLRQKSNLILSVTILAACAGGLYISLAPRIYSSRAVLLVDQRANKVVDMQEVSQQDLEAMDVMKTIEQSLTTDQLLLAVIAENKLGSNPDFLPQRANDPYTDDQLIKALSKDLKVKIRRGTRLIDVEAQSKSPALAKKLSDAVVAEYLNSAQEMRGATSASAYMFLSREADRLKAKLEKSEQELEGYKEKNNAISLEEKQNIVTETLKSVNFQLNEARSQRMKLESDLTQYKQLAQSNPRGLLVIGAIANAPEVLDMKKRLADQQEQIAKLAQRYRVEHPSFIEAQSQLRQCETDLDKAVLKAGENIEAAYLAAQTNEHKLADALREQEQVSFALNKIAVPYNMLVRNVEADRDMYQSVMTRMKQTDVTKLLETAPLRVIESPRVSTKPISPKPLLVMAVALFGGGVCGIGLALLTHAMDGSIHTVEDAENTLDLPVWAALPKARGRRRKPQALPLLNSPASETAERFRCLRTGLELKEITHRQTILFTSALPAEGKSFCSMNCAISLAQQGYRTLLIDADLRRPTIGAIMKCKPDAPGLTDYLIGTDALSSAIQASQVNNLFILPAGSTVRNPAELLASRQMHDILADPALAAYDRFVFDTPPVNAVSDSLRLLHHATTTCLVVRAGTTPATAVQRACKALVAAKGTDIGLILNQLKPLHFNRHAVSYHAEGVYSRTTAA